TNSGTYTIASVTATTLTLTAANSVTAGSFVETFHVVGVPNTTDSDYQSAALNSGLGSTQSIFARVIDDETAGVFLQESGGSTLVTSGTTSSPPPTTGDSYTMRLTKPPTAPVNIAIVTDGQTDVNQNSGRITLQPVGGKQPTKLFTGNITISGTTIT